MTAVRRLVIDVLKLHDPPLLVFTDQLAEIESVGGVTSSLMEDTIENLGGSVHSVDQVACGDSVVTDRRTLQDS